MNFRVSPIDLLATSTALAGEQSMPKHRREEKHDPVIVAIADYETKLASFKKALRRVQDLKKRLPANVNRSPQVQMSFYLKRDNNNNEVREPIFAHHEFEIKSFDMRHMASTMSIQGGAPRYWVDGKQLKRPRHTPETLKRRAEVLRRYRGRWRDKAKELKADRDQLEAKQRECGWWQAVEAECAASKAFYHSCYKLTMIRPTTMNGAIALGNFLNLCCKRSLMSPERYNKYQMGDTYTARIARNLVSVIEATV